MSKGSTLDKKLGRGFREFGEGNFIREPPKIDTEYFADFSGGYDTRKLNEGKPMNYSPDALDVELDDRYRIIRAPGNAAVETLAGKSPEQIGLHASLDFRSELILFDAPFFGVKRDAATTWTNLALPTGRNWFWATYGEWLIFSNGRKVYEHLYGTNTATEISDVMTGADFAVWAGRFWVGGALIGGTLEPLGLLWSGADNYDDSSSLTGAGFELMLQDIGVGDRNVALRPMGYDFMAILNRRSIWIARKTGDPFRPGDIQPREVGKGCVAQRTARTVSGGVIYLSDEGVELFDGNQSHHLSAQIDAEIVPIQKANIARYWSMFNPAMQKYYLGVPDQATYVLDLTKKCWYKRSLKAIDAVPFAQQFDATTWAEAVGSWGAATGSWIDKSPVEADVPDTTFLGQKADLAHYLEKESDTSLQYFGYPQTARWTSYLRNPADTRLATYRESRIKFSGIGRVMLQLPDASGALVDTGDLQELAAASDAVVGITRIKTGLGLGFGLRIVAGTPAIAGFELDYLMRSRTVARSIYGAGKITSVIDTMTGATGTDLIAHVADSGFTWAHYTSHPSGLPQQAKISANKAAWVVNTRHGYLCSYVPPSAEQEISADVSFTASVNDLVRLFARGESLGTPNTYDQWHGYTLSLRQGGQLILAKGAANGGAQLGIYESGALADGAVRNIKLSCRGTTIEAWVDGVKRIQVIDATFATPGRVGLYCLGGTSAGSNANVDNYTIDTFS